MARVTKAEKKAASDAVADRLKMYGPTASLPVWGHPPLPLREGEGPAEWQAGGEFPITLDGAGFRALWRYVEAHALQLHNNPSPHCREPEAAFLRLVESFRRASGQKPEEKPAPKTWGTRTNGGAPVRSAVRHQASSAVKKWAKG